MFLGPGQTPPPVPGGTAGPSEDAWRAAGRGALAVGKEVAPTFAGFGGGAAALKIGGQLGLALRPSLLQFLGESAGAALGGAVTGEDPLTEAATQAGANLGVKAVGAGLGAARRGVTKLFTGPGTMERAAVAKEAGVPATLPELGESDAGRLVQTLSETGISGQVIRRRTLQAGDRAAQRYAKDQLTLRGGPAGATRPSTGRVSDVANTIYKARETGARLGRKKEQALWEPIAQQPVDISSVVDKDLALAQEIALETGFDTKNLPSAGTPQAAGYITKLLKNHFANSPMTLGEVNALRSRLLSEGRISPSQGLRTSRQGSSQHRADVLTEVLEEQANTRGFGPEFQRARQHSFELHELYDRPNRVGQKIRAKEETPEQIIDFLKPDGGKRASRLKEVLFRYVDPGTPEAAEAVLAWDNTFDLFMKKRLGAVVEGGELNFKKLPELAGELERYKDVLDVLVTSPGRGVDPRKAAAVKNLGLLSQVLSSRVPEMNIRTAFLTNDIKAVGNLLSMNSLRMAGAAAGAFTVLPEIATGILSKIIHSESLTNLMLRGLTAKSKEVSRAAFTLLSKELYQALSGPEGEGSPEAAKKAEVLMEELAAAEAAADRQKVDEIMSQLQILSGGR